MNSSVRLTLFTQELRNLMRISCWNVFRSTVSFHTQHLRIRTLKQQDWYQPAKEARLWELREHQALLVIRDYSCAVVFLYPGKEECLGICQQYHSCTKLTPTKHLHYQTWRQGNSNCRRLLAAPGSSSCKAISWLQGKFGPFAIPSLPAP